MGSTRAVVDCMLDLEVSRRLHHLDDRYATYRNASHTEAIGTTPGTRPREVLADIYERSHHASQAQLEAQAFIESVGLTFRQHVDVLAGRGP